MKLPPNPSWCEPLMMLRSSESCRPLVGVLEELAPVLPSVNAPVTVTRRNPGIMFAILMPTSGPSN